MGTHARLALAVAGVGGLLLLVAAAHVLWMVLDYGRAEATLSDMRGVMMLLDTYQPEHTDAASIRRLLVREHRAEWVEDAWGRPLVITRQLRRGEPFYTIRSLGRSGRPGPCCTPRVKSWDDNVVLAGNDWLQVWAHAK